MLRAWSVLVVAAFLIPSLSCTPDETAARPDFVRYRVEVLAENIDPTLIPDPLNVDFDEDGELDRVSVTDSSVRIDLTGGAVFNLSVRGPDDESPRIWDAKVVSLRPDGKFPSLVLATCPESSHDEYPVTQQLVYNDAGTLVHKWQGVYPAANQGQGAWAYPMRALGLDCAWLHSNDLPVCFFASMEDGALGVSRLIELDPNGYKRLASDSALASHYHWRMERRWERFRRVAMDSTQVVRISGSARDVVWDWLRVDSASLARSLPGYLPNRNASFSDTLLAALDLRTRSDPRDRAQAYLRLEGRVFDSIVAVSDARASDSAVDFFLAVALSRLDHEAIFSRDVTREYHLPWPAQPGHGRPFVDGMAMMDAVFLDFSGDGLLDLVVVGQHSRPFSAVQHPDGYFADAAFHSVPDEYVRVWAPTASSDAGVTPPPCVYYGMEKTEEEAWRSDHVECFDRGSGTWYEVTLPAGPFWTEYEPVVFWDVNDDGRMDFAARREDGSWTLLTFTAE